MDNAPQTVESRRITFAHDDELLLMLPEDDVVDPEVSIVIPALNEEKVISQFMDWCHEGIRKAGVVAEILIIDSSTDHTSEIALAKGARLLKTPLRGLGQAYRDAIPVIRGKYVICGDADCTYDFREIAPFIAKFREGYEFVMGSRFTGSIEPGAMPPLHRYFGTPLTNFILNFIYGTKFTDIHCGMRGVTLDALKRMNLRSRSWEYASEMIVKSVRLKLKTAQAPVKFYKDIKGRVSHHKRMGWFSPWHAGWINLRTMLVHGADFFVMKPGAVLFTLGLLISLALAAGPLTLAGVTFSLNTMMLGSTLSIAGLQFIFLGCMAQSLYDPSGGAVKHWLKVFAYSRTMLGSFAVFLVGLALTSIFLLSYMEADFLVAPGLLRSNHLAVVGLLAIVLSFQTFISTLLLHAIAAYMVKNDNA